MAERVIVRQDREFWTTFEASDPDDPDGAEVQAVHAIGELTPYHMLLASLGSCTAIILNTYAQHHGLDLQSVELRLSYDRYFPEDCERCEEIDQYEERIDEELALAGDLTPQERQRLYAVSKHCPIHKMIGQGIEVRSRLA